MNLGRLAGKLLEAVESSVHLNAIHLSTNYIPIEIVKLFDEKLNIRQVDPPERKVRKFREDAPVVKNIKKEEPEEMSEEELNENGERPAEVRKERMMNALSKNMLKKLQ